MKEFVTVFAVVSLLPQLQGQVLFTYDFTGADPGGDAGAPTVANLSLSPFARVNVGVVSQADVFSSSYWTTGVTCDPNEFVSFTLQPDSGYSLRLDRLEWESSRSTTGPQTGRVSLFKDGNMIESSPDFAIGTTMANGVFDFSDITAVAGETLEFRFHGWNASSTGNLRLDNVSGVGQMAMVPEPAGVATAAAAGLVAFAIHRRVKRAQA